nr:hypothetical protein [Tanacetum cinerariifolium]
MYYGQLEEILEFSFTSFKVVLFRIKWFDTSNKGRKFQRSVTRNNITQIFVVDDHDVIHNNNSFGLALSANLNDFDFATLNIDGQSTEVEAPPAIIHVDVGDYIIDEDDVLYDLADFDNEVLTNSDDDDDEVMAAKVARSHGGDGVGNPHPPSIWIGSSRYCKNFWIISEKLKLDHLNLLLLFDGVILGARRGKTVEEGMKAGRDNHFAKCYSDNKYNEYPSLLARLLEGQRLGCCCGCDKKPPPSVEQSDSNEQIKFWLDPKHVHRAAINAQNMTQNTIFNRHGSSSLAVTRYQYEAMIKLLDLGASTPTGVTYAEKEILAMVIKGKQWGHITGRGRQLAGIGKSKVFSSQPQGMYMQPQIDKCYRRETSGLLTLHERLRPHDNNSISKQYLEDMSSGNDWSNIVETLTGKCVAPHGRRKKLSGLLLPTSCCRGSYVNDVSSEELYVEDVSSTKAPSRLLGKTRLL